MLKLSCIPACTVSVSLCHLVHASLHGHYNLRHESEGVEALFAHAMSCWNAGRAVTVPQSPRPVLDCMHVSSISPWQFTISLALVDLTKLAWSSALDQVVVISFNFKSAHGRVALKVSWGVPERSLLSLQPKITQPLSMNLQTLLAASCWLLCTSNNLS